MTLESCVESYSEALLAQQNGANQIELCSRLDLDGLTPNFELTVALTQILDIPIKVMIRPRSGNFAYTSKELDRMLAAIERFHKLNIDGFVFGVSNHDKTLNYQDINKLAKACSGKSVCIHKAIDACEDVLGAFNGLLSNCPAVTHVLSSGGAATAIEGQETLKELSLIEQDQIKIIPAGKITSENLADLHAILDLEIYHGRRIV